MNRGGRNLLILGASAILIALIGTAFSLKIYHDSGDIYLDRSRPGFLPDKNEKPLNYTEYKFSETGPVSSEDLDQYLKELDKLIKEHQSLPDPFSEEPLSDRSLELF